MGAIVIVVWAMWASLVTLNGVQQKQREDLERKVQACETRRASPPPPSP